MSVLSAQSIRQLCSDKPNGWGGDWPKPMVYPFFERKEVYFNNKFKNWLVPGIWQLAKDYPRFSFGLSSAGYDIRIAEDIIIWPLFGRLASSIEKFNMPNDVMAEVKDKSSWARRFLTVQNTVIEPGWNGYLTLELTNHRLWPIKLRAGTPIAQIIFYNLDQPTLQPYIGKYQNAPQGSQKAK